MMTALLEYFAFSMQAEKWSSQCHRPWAPVLLSTTAIDSIMYGTVMLIVMLE